MSYPDLLDELVRAARGDAAHELEILAQLGYGTSLAVVESQYG